MWLSLEQEAFNNNYLYYLVNNADAHLLEFVIDKCITFIGLNDFVKAKMYTFPFPKLRKLLLFLIWGEDFIDFSMKRSLIAFASND